MKNIDKYLFLPFVLCLFVFSDLKADESPADYRINVPSPQAYAFAQYADMPVSLYTGIPSIEVPLFTIEIGNFTFPITLSYHASGIKVSQEASWVGLGWNLNAGGNISRTVRGLDDLMGGYYYQDAQIPDQFDNSRDDIVSLVGVDAYNLVVRINADTEPDVFYYNFAGYSGIFYAKNSGRKEENGFYLCDPEQNLKMSFTYKDQSFSIISPDGTRYLFKPSASTGSATVVLEGFRMPYTDMTRFPFFEDRVQNMITSWDLSEIILPNKEKIEFEYITVAYPFLPSSASIIQKKYLPVYAVKNTGFPVYATEKYETVCSMSMVNYQKFLKKITWSSGYIMFETSSRKDFVRNTFKPGGENLKLDKMSLFRTGDSAPFKEVVFHESYFSNPDEPEDQYNLRLRLDSLSVCSGQIREIHRFGYDVRHSLPPKYSFAQDMWGYYNGLNNTIFYPEISVSRNYYKADGKTIVYKKGDILRGADRKPRAEYITTGMLTSMESPEGGVTTFEYEPNDAISEYSEIVFLHKDTLYKPYNVEVDTFHFTLHTDGWIKLDFLYNEGAMGVGGSAYKNNMISIYNSAGKEVKTWGSQNFPDIPFTYTIKDSSKYDKGNYYLVFRTDNYLNQNLKLAFYGHFNRIGLVQGGGVRIFRIKSPVNTREFTYTDATGHASSGIFIRKPFYESMQTYATYSTFLDNDGSIRPVRDGFKEYIVQQSESVYPLAGPSINAAVGYSRVCMTTCSDDKFFKEDYFYHNEEEAVDFRYVGMPGECIYMNGKLLTHNIYEDSQLIKNIKYEYKCDTIAVLNAWFQDYCNMGDIGTYHVPIGHCRIERETEGCFDTRSLTKYWKTTRYKQYNPHNYLPSEISVDDGLKEKTVRTIYTVDLNHIPLYSEMCGNTGNRITDPVEIRTYDNSGLIQKELHTYKKNEKNGSFVPDAVYNYYRGSPRPASDFDGSNISQYGLPDYMFSCYDKYDNVIEVKSRTGESEVYIYGYGGRYVIARIQNATLEEVEKAGIGAVDSFATGTELSEEEWNKLNALRILLPRALVYVYKYEPMVGVISITDPKGMTLYYEYDAKGRLAVERDGDNNVIRSYRYTLKNEK